MHARTHAHMHINCHLSPAIRLFPSYFFQFADSALTYLALFAICVAFAAAVRI